MIQHINDQLDYPPSDIQLKYIQGSGMIVGLLYRQGDTNLNTYTLNYDNPVKLYLSKKLQIPMLPDATQNLKRLT